MMRKLSEEEASGLIVESCPLFRGINSFDELRQEGWIINNFFTRGIPYIWRDNRRISEDRFWCTFMEVFAMVGETSGLILFCDGRSWWKKNGKEPRLFDCLYDVVDFMNKYAFYDRRHWVCGRKNDNYNLVFLNKDVFVSFTHEGELLCFSRRLGLLRSIKHLWRSRRLSCHSAF